MKPASVSLACAVLAIMSASAAWGDTVDDAYGDFIRGRYSPVFDRLLPYRVENEGTLRVDFMLAVSSCRLSGEYKDFGGYLLAQIPRWYSLNDRNRRDVRIQAQACPWTGISETAALSRISGKADASDRPLSTRHDADGGGGLPPVPVIVQPPPPTIMSPLMYRRDYPGRDYTSVITASPGLCAARCLSERKCVAVTYVVEQKRCWLKNSLPPPRDRADTISAVRQLGRPKN